MRQKVAVARTIARDPELLLLDEPSTGLDDSAREIVRSMILDASTRGRTIVLATHQAAPASLEARVVSMRDGQISRTT